MQGVEENNPKTTVLSGSGDENYIQNIADDSWEELGQDIASNTHLESLSLYERALNDHKSSCLFRKLTRSSSITDVSFCDNGLSAVGVRSMVPFLQNANNLKDLYLDENNIRSEGFNIMFRALRDSPIETLSCDSCGIDSIEIDTNCMPRKLRSLFLSENSISADGCRGLAKLLQGGDAALTSLYLRNNQIDDEGVQVLAEALQSNTSLTTLNLRGNDGISKEGMTMLLTLINDVSSMKATLQSNHTLTSLHVKEINHNELDPHEEIKTHIHVATMINRRSGSDPNAAGRKKVIQTQLHSQNRAELCRLQGIDRSLYSEIDPLHLPEVLSLIAQRHGQGELYAAVLSSIMTLFSTMNREKCIQQKMEYHAAKSAEYEAMAAGHRTKLEELDKELATIKEAVAKNQDNAYSQSNKRRRT